MPYKEKGAGSLILDRRTPVGRIKKASGTTEAPLFRRLNTMVTDLCDAARYDYLRSVRDGNISLLEAYELYRVHGATKLPSLDSVQGLKAMLDKWVIDAECSVKHRRTHKTMAKKVLEGARPDATMADFPLLVEAMRARYKAKKTNAGFNRLRVSAQSFVRDTLKRSHPIYGAVCEVPELKERKKRQNNPQTPEQVAELVKKLTTPLHRACVWGMVLTGMGPGEFFGKWSAKADRVHIEGTKRDSRVRDVPRVRADLYVSPKPPRGEDPEWTARKFSDTLKEITDGAVQPYDFRRTYATFMEICGIPRTRRRAYMGHAAGDVTAIYEFQEVARYLAEDAERLNAYLKDAIPPQAAPLTLHTTIGA